MKGFLLSETEFVAITGISQVCTQKTVLTNISNLVQFNNNEQNLALDS